MYFLLLGLVKENSILYILLNLH